MHKAKDPKQQALPRMVLLRHRGGCATVRAQGPGKVAQGGSPREALEMVSSTSASWLQMQEPHILLRNLVNQHIETI